MRLAIWLCAALSAAGGSMQTFRTDVDAVRVDVLVTDRNRPIAGLSKSISTSKRVPS